MASVLAAFLLALATSLVLTPVVAGWSMRRGFVAHPRADRWSTRTVALMGGLAIVAATVVGWLPVVGRLTADHWLVLLAALAMFLVGLVDDRRNIKPHTKLLAQIIAAVLLVQSGLTFGLVLPGAWAHVDQVLTVVFLVGIANALNLLDNMDGLCAGIAAIAAVTLVVLQVGGGQFETAALSAAVAGACLGFLRYNFAPARIFMGDCGSLFLGLFLGGATLLDQAAGQTRHMVSVLALPVLVLLIPVLDTTLVTILRKWNRRPLSQGGCDHTSHRLVAIGLSERRAVLFLYSLAAAGGLVAVAVRWLDWYLGQLLLPVFLLAIGAVGMFLGQVRVYEDTTSLGDLLDKTPIPLLGQHRYRRRLVEVGIDTLAIGLGYHLAHLLRFENGLAAPHVANIFRQSVGLIVICHLVAYFVTGVYRGIWRYTSVTDLPRFVRATGLGLLLSLAALAATGLWPGMSRSLLALNWIVQLCLLTGTRVGVKYLRDFLLASAHHTARPVLLVGLGEETELALRRMRLHPDLGLVAGGIVCEDPAAVGLEVFGAPVLGNSEAIRDILGRGEFTEVVLADSAYPTENWQQIKRVCRELRVPTREFRTQLLRAGDDLDDGALERAAEHVKIQQRRVDQQRVEPVEEPAVPR